MSAILSQTAHRMVHEPDTLILGKCRLCGCQLDAGEEDDLTNELCSSCKARPEARRIVVNIGQRRGTQAPKTTSAREITPAEKALIRKLHGFMPAQQLLDILNERLFCDLGPDASPYTMDQLYAEIGDDALSAAAGGQDWASLRKLLAKARKSGVLAQINEQVINDFAVVYSLNAKQVLGLKDILLHGEEGEE